MANVKAFDPTVTVGAILTIAAVSPLAGAASALLPVT
jgi:hypothetical protein